MKTIMLSVVVLVSICQPADSQLTLNAGDSFSYQFSSLPLINGTPPFPLGAVYGESRPLTPFAPPGAFSFRLDLFESSFSEVPILSRTFSTPVPIDPSECCDFTGTAPNAWQDLQGAVRISMLSGSVTFDQLGLFVQRHDGQYEQVVTVPEPRTLGLFSVALAGFILRAVWCACRKEAAYTALEPL